MFALVFWRQRVHFDVLPMKMKPAHFILLVALTSIAANSNAEDGNATSSKTIAEYTKLRWAVFAQHDYTPDWNQNERKSLLQLATDGYYSQFLKKSGPWVKQIPIDIQIHGERATAFYDAGDFREGNRSLFLYRGLLASIFDSGDGKTIENAFEVTSSHEIDAVLYELDATQVAHALLPSGHRKLTCRYRKGGTVILYFDVRRMTAKLNALAKPTTEAEQAEDGNPGDAPE